MLSSGDCFFSSRHRAAVKGLVDIEELRASVVKFEEKIRWCRQVKVKCVSQPQDSGLIHDFVCKVFSTEGHPLSSLLGQYQYDIYQKLLPLIKHASAPITVPLSSFVPKAGAKHLPVQRIMSSDKLETASQALPSDVSNHSLESRLTALLMKTDPHISLPENMDNDDDDDEGLDQILDRLEVDQREPSKSFVALSAPTKEEKPSPPPTPAAVRKLGLSWCTNDEVDLSEVCEEHLKYIVHDVHTFMDHLERFLLSVYGEFCTVSGRDQCRSAIEASFFPQFWHVLLSVFRLANIGQEKALAAAMTSHHMKLPAEMGVPERLCLKSEDGSSDLPYQNAIAELKRVTALTSPLSKLECISSVSRAIWAAVETYWSARGKGKQSKEMSLASDDLLNILGYVIVQSGLPQLVSECSAMEEFIHEGYLMGEEGFCLTTLMTALAYISSLASKLQPTNV